MTAALCDYAGAIAYELLDERTQHQAKVILVDSIASALAATRHPSVDIARTLALQARGHDGWSSTVLGTRHRSTPELAVFANCTMMRCLDHNDTYHSHDTGHPSDQIPGILAAAELAGASGREVLSATVLAYEIFCRLCDVATIRGWQSATFTAISSAAATSQVLGLSRRQTANAIALAVVSHAALKVFTHGSDGLMWLTYADANAVRQGLFAALLARQGVEGPSRPFEDENGFFERVSAGPFRLPALGGNDHGYRIHDVLVKKYGTCSHLQTAAEAALELHARLTPGVPIRSIRVVTNARTIFNCARPDRWRPDGQKAAHVSLPYCVAVVLLDGAIGEDQYTDERIHDPEVARLMQRVEVVESPAYSDRYPESSVTAIEVVDEHGAAFVAECSATEGFPQIPMTAEQVSEKFDRLAAPALSPRLRQAALDVLWNVECLEDVGLLFGLLAAD
ncbi:MmgE/PrpD family protein [Nocardioides humi]|uniref:MmgE/PrpD family protein n=1 Tax=Nocardioides humi TaxID=449461 RepID=A0ABN2BT38_9ACTN